MKIFCILRASRQWTKQRFYLLFRAFIFLWFTTTFYATTHATSDMVSVRFKNWSDYTVREKEILRERWSPTKIREVIAFLKTNGQIPKFIAKLPSLTSSPGSFHYDLRSITLSSFCHDLSNVSLSQACLQGAELWAMNLQGAEMVEANLQGARLTGVNLKSAFLEKADLKGALMSWANLEGAVLCRATLKDANLEYANLRLANLKGANLKNTNLFGAGLDSTYLFQVNLDEAENIRYLRWGDTNDTRYIIGEEILADSTRNDQDLRNAQITYRDLKSFYRKQLLEDEAAEFNYRENVVQTKRCSLLSKNIRIFFLESTYGYGSRPVRLFWFSLSVVVAFCMIFSLMTIVSYSHWTKSGVGEPDYRGEPKLLPFRRGFVFFDCFYFSLISFATFGYGALRPRQWLQFFRLESVEYVPIRWARILVGIEAALGIWIFALLVTVLFGK